MLNKNKIVQFIKKYDRKSIISVLVFVAAILTVLYYMFGPSEGYLQSDCADTLTWAMASVDSGKFFSETFCYPYLLPFGATFLFFPFAAVFGFSMLTLRLSMLLFMLLFGLAAYYTAKAMGWSRNSALIAVALEFITVSSSQKLRELFWEHIIHYSLGIFLAFVLMALLFAFMKRFSENNFKLKRDTKILAVLMGLWVFFSTFDGLTTLTLSTIPVLAGCAAVAILDNKSSIFSKRNLDIFIPFIIIIIGTVLGKIAFELAAGDISQAYGDAYSLITDGNNWGNNITKLLFHWTTLLGADYEFGASITKAQNIFAALKLAGSLVIVLTPIYGFFAYNKFNRYEKIFFIYHWCMTGFILYAVVIGNLSDVNWRLSPIACSAVMVCLIIWKKLWENAELKRTAVLASLLVAVFSAITVGQIAAMPYDYGRDDSHHKALKILEKYDLDYGYATYWNANILTLLSDDEIKVRELIFNDSAYNKGWLNLDKRWYENRLGRQRYFVLLTEDEYSNMLSKNNLILNDTSATIRDSGWVILIRNNNVF